MALGKIRGSCESLTLLTLDSIHLSVRDLQTSGPSSPITEFQLGGRVRGLKKEIEKREETGPEPPQQMAGAGASGPRFRPKVHHLLMSRVS